MIGYNTSQFEIEALAIIREVFPNLAQSAIRTRLGRHGKYLAMTVTVEVEERQQLDRVYESLSASQHVLWAL